MRKRFLTVAVALVSVFFTQQTFAKSSTITPVSHKKHHKKHANKIASAPTAKTVAVMS
jgi:hypothetical protein